MLRTCPEIVSELLLASQELRSQCMVPACLQKAEYAFGMDKGQHGLLMCTLEYAVPPLPVGGIQQEPHVGNKYIATNRMLLALIILPFKTVLCRKKVYFSGEFGKCSVRAQIFFIVI